MRARRLVPLVLLPLSLLAWGCRTPGHLPRLADIGPLPASDAAQHDPLALIARPRTAAERIVNGAKLEARRRAVYDASYRAIAYPGGDVPRDRGACTDVVIRALRHAGYDLQRLIHEDMRAHFSRYPRRYGLRRPDPNIDHRRVPNQTTFFTRFGKRLTGEYHRAESWRPGDIVVWKLDNGLLHTGICSDVRGRSGYPLVIHNLGITEQVDCLQDWEIVGHYRYPPG